MSTDEMLEWLCARFSIVTLEQCGERFYCEARPYDDDTHPRGVVGVDVRGKSLRAAITSAYRLAGGPEEEPEEHGPVPDEEGAYANWQAEQDCGRYDGPKEDGDA